MLYLRATKELLGIIDVLMTLNTTGLYTAFYNYFANIGVLDIEIYMGRWNYLKTAELKFSIDCRKYPLKRIDDQKEISAEELLQQLISLVQ